MIGATAVPLTVGSTTSLINASLIAAGAISGTVTDTRSDPLQTAVVQIWTTSAAPGVVAVASTASDGTYAVAGLAAGTYNVCFEGNYATGGSSTTGYVEQCYRGVTWDGYSSGPIGATGVTVAAGAIASNIDASLSSGGVVTGTVTDTSSNPLQGVYVEISQRVPTPAWSPRPQLRPTGRTRLPAWLLEPTTYVSKATTRLAAAQPPATWSSVIGVSLGMATRPVLLEPQE